MRRNVQARYARAMADDSGWRRSSEGDLDPDLTEEAGYAGWDPPRRSGWRIVFRVLLVVVLLSIVASALMAVRW